MLKLILIFRSVSWPQRFLVQRTHFLSVETTFYLFFKYYPVKNRLEQRYYLKRSYVWATWSFYINPVQQKIHRRWVDNVEVIAKKLGIEDEYLLLMIPELYTSLASCFWIKVITKNILVLHLFCDISSFKSEEGHTTTLSRKGFIY